MDSLRSGFTGKSRLFQYLYILTKALLREITRLDLIAFLDPSSNPRHDHLQVQPNPKKNCTKKPMQFLVSMGNTGLTHDIFFLILT